MSNIYDRLVLLDGFLDNEFLSKYATIIERNRNTRVTPRITNKHHIIPKSWFKINNREVDNSTYNLVNLAYRDHVLAHYYLCLCTEGQLQYANQLALLCLTSRKKLNIVEKQLVHNLPLYNNIYENYLEKRKNNFKLYTE